ncbi:uncharacterized protein LOC131251531 isoform X1 [Magnolia sinica]|uniref:uncharacterized protein LOC131251531 isoform X1 n=1 Tax=Magnolia sinica TaxID=86752 RepID=UPI00265B4C3F|nr:uncharacterized protein LOC131251531 isoform X1 [Magnolia sinica]
MKVAMTTLSSKILSQDKEHSAKLAVDAVMRLKVCMIFISGLPTNLKERELQNQVRWLLGYEASQLNFKGEQPMGFALSSTAHLSLAAKADIQASAFKGPVFTHADVKPDMVVKAKTMYLAPIRCKNGLFSSFELMFYNGICSLPFLLIFIICST